MTREEIKKLNDYQHVRLRINMYFGSNAPHTQQVVLYDQSKPYIDEVTWIPALYTSFREILDNALDEVVGYGYGNKIDVSYDENTRIFKVSDNGRGIPIDYNSVENSYTATLVLTHARTGRNFNDRGEVAGTNGIGGSGVVFTSEWFKVDITRDGQRFTQEFREGNLVFDNLIVEEPKIKKTSSSSTGTTLEWKPSENIFPNFILSEKFVRSRIFEIAAANPNISFTYNGEKIKVKPFIEKTLFADRLHMEVNIATTGFRTMFIIVPNFTDGDEFFHSIVNSIPAFNGGAHVDQFRRQFVSQMLSYLEKEGKKRKLTPTRSDVLDKLLIYSVTNMKAPNFDSQSKTRLVNEEAATYVRNALNDEKIFKDLIKKNKVWIDEIFARCAERTNQKDMADIERANKKLVKRKVAKLIEANSSNRRECICLFTEGDSAIAGMSAARNPKIHAGIPLRGKVLNVTGENPKKVIDNKELMDIMTAVGLKIGERADRNKLRYGKIFIAADADPDGLNITALLTNFFFTYWPELFDKDKDPYVHVFLTPFIIAEKGKERKYWYSYNYEEFKPEDWKGWSITRAKGLGSLQKEDWKQHLDKPVTYALLNDGNMKESLDLIFNENRSDDRKQWISL